MAEAGRAETASRPGPRPTRLPVILKPAIEMAASEGDHSGVGGSSTGPERQTCSLASTRDGQGFLIGLATSAYHGKPAQPPICSAHLVKKGLQARGV